MMLETIASTGLQLPRLAAVHLDSLLFLLLIGITGLFRLLMKKGEQDNGDEPPAPRSRPQTSLPQQPQGDEERIRKFLEALGQPTTNKPPPPVRPRPVEPAVTEFQRRQVTEAARTARRRNLLNPLPPLTTMPPVEESRRVFVPRPVATPAYETTTAVPPPLPLAPEGAMTPPPLPLSPLPPVEAYVIPASVSAASTARSEMATLFSSPDDLRRVIILREVLGPPRSLQPLESTEHP